MTTGMAEVSGLSLAVRAALEVPGVTQVMQRWSTCQVASAGAWPSHGPSCPSRTFCCWTSPPTTWSVGRLRVLTPIIYPSPSLVSLGCKLAMLMPFQPRTRKHLQTQVLAIQRHSCESFAPGSSAAHGRVWCGASSWGLAVLQDAQSVAWLERTLAAFKGTVVAVTHDR